MKTLLLIRHAKSDWTNAFQKDFDRTLNDRGKKNAPEMAKRLLDKKIPIDLVIASPAKRAKKTAELFAEVYGIDKSAIVFFEELYLAPASVFYDVIKNTSDNYHHIAVFSHNSGITDFANLLTATRIDNIPTSGVFGIKVNTSSWVDFETGEKQFWFFDYPKSITGY